MLQTDAYGGYAGLYKPGREPGPVLEASCWAHARRKFFELADIEGASLRKARSEKPKPVYPLALQAVLRIDALFAIERELLGRSPSEPLAVRQVDSKPRVEQLEIWLRDTATTLTRGHDLAKAIRYMLNCWPSFTRLLSDGRNCMSNNPAERALRGVALGRKSRLSCGSDRGALSSRRTVRRCAAPWPLIARSISNRASMRRTISKAIGEMTADAFPRALRRAFSARSAITKNGRRACGRLHRVCRSPDRRRPAGWCHP